MARAASVDYAHGTAFSIPAIPFRGGSNDGDRAYQFDDAEYGKMPRIVAAGSGASFGSAAAWGRLLYQSVTTDDAVELILEGAPLGME